MVGSKDSYPLSHCPSVNLITKRFHSFNRAWHKSFDNVRFPFSVKIDFYATVLKRIWQVCDSSNDLRTIDIQFLHNVVLILSRYVSHDPAAGLVAVQHTDYSGLLFWIESVYLIQEQRSANARLKSKQYCGRGIKLWFGRSTANRR